MATRFTKEESLIACAYLTSYSDEGTDAESNFKCRLKYLDPEYTFDVE